MSFSASLRKAAALAALLVVAFVVGREVQVRRAGYGLSYNDDDSLWASQHRRIYQPAASGPVLIGSSRIKFDLDLATWTRLTGREPVQLALTGTSPRPVLTALGNDPNFRGTVLVDVVEGLFFAPDGAPQERKAHERLRAWPKWSLAQQASFWLDQKLESRLVLLDEEELTLNAFFRKLPLPDRPGVRNFPRFADNFATNGPDRQSAFTASFVRSPAKQAQMKAAWRKLGAGERKRGAGGDTLLAQLRGIKRAVDQIRGRGGRVLFLRFPSTGEFRAAETRCYPRALFWDRLLAYTQTPGIYYADYPALARFDCPEWSHLAPADAVRFTEALVPLCVNEQLSMNNEQ